MCRLRMVFSLWLLNASDRERNSAKKKQAAELKKAEKRKAEVDGL